MGFKRHIYNQVTPDELSAVCDKIRQQALDIACGTASSFKTMEWFGKFVIDALVKPAPPPRCQHIDLSKVYDEEGVLMHMTCDYCKKIFR